MESRGYIRILVALSIMVMALIHTGVTKGQTQEFYTVFDEVIILPVGSSRGISIDNSTGGSRYRAYSVDGYDAWLMCIQRTNPNPSPDCVASPFLQDWVNNPPSPSAGLNVANTSTNVTSGIRVVVQVFGIDPSKLPTATPAINPTTPGGGGGGGEGGQLCGLEGQPPCRVIVENFPTLAPIPTWVMECGVEGKPPCQVEVTNFPTPIPTSTMIPAVETAIAAANSPLNPQAAPYGGAPDALPIENSDEVDPSIASIEKETYSFGCPIDTVVYSNIRLKLCLSYIYLKSVSLAGAHIPLDMLGGVVLLIALARMIRSR